MKHGSLFSGIGGFDYAAQMMGWENLFHCEWNEFGQKVLKHHWPTAESFNDITKTDFTPYANRIDILTGGFPCQPYSLAGKRKGKEDERHLWPEMLRAIREIQPRWVVGENVFGLVNWSGGLVFHEVQGDLEAAGYEVFPYVLPAAAVNAPHRRDRVWFVAHSKGNRDRRKLSGLESQDGCKWEPEKHWENNLQHWNDGSQRNATHPNSNGQHGCNSEHEVNPSEGRVNAQCDIEQMGGNVADTIGIGQSGKEHGQTERRRFAKTCVPGNWENFPTQPPVCTGNDGVSTDTHIRTIQNENSMDRSLVIKACLDKGYLFVDYENGKVYSTRSRNRMEHGMAIELPGAICNGYKVHNIYFEGIKKQCRAHQIVWISAHGLYDKEKYMIDHIDRDKENNRLSNLRLVDAQGNRDNATEYNGKLSQEEKDRMFALYEDGNMSIRELAEDFGISKSRVHQLITEHSQLDGITFPKWRNESIKAAGNAIVPQVAFQIFKAIEQYEEMH